MFWEPVGIEEEGAADACGVEQSGEFGGAVALEGHVLELFVGY